MLHGGRYYQQLCLWGIRIVVVFGQTSIKISTRKVFRKNVAES